MIYLNRWYFFIIQKKLKRVDKGFSIKKYGFEIFEDYEINPIKDVWTWFKSIFNKLNNLPDLEQTGILVYHWGKTIRHSFEEAKTKVRGNTENMYKYSYGTKYLAGDVMPDEFRLLGWTRLGAHKVGFFCF